MIADTITAASRSHDLLSLFFLPNASGICEPRSTHRLIESLTTSLFALNVRADTPPLLRISVTLGLNAEASDRQKNDGKLLVSSEESNGVKKLSGKSEVRSGLASRAASKAW